MNATLPPPPRLEIVQQPLLPWIEDKYLAVFLPSICYWLVSMIFHVLDEFELAEKYRIHTPAEKETRNKCTVREVIISVLIQQMNQFILGCTMAYFEPPYTIGHEDYDIWRLSQLLGTNKVVSAFLYNWVYFFGRMAVSFLLMDTWQYMIHRYMHINKWAYRNLHAVHHRLHAPYAFGALYNTISEGFLLDAVGAGLTSLVMGLSPRENIVLYTFSTIKTVDDHCGYEFPWDPLQWVFPNRAAYHDIHHQPFGIKSNFSQPFFVHWDTLLNTKYEKTEEYIENNKLLREKAFEEKKKQKQIKSEKKKLE